MINSVYIQAWDKSLFPDAKFWDDIHPVSMDIENAALVAQDIADRLNCSVRLTVRFNNIPAGRLSGSYFQPKVTQSCI